MPLNIDRVQKFLTKLRIRDRDFGTTTPFVLREQQIKVLQMAKDHLNKKKTNRLYLIFLKARRVGLSTLSAGLLTAHCLSRPTNQALIVAQKASIAKAMFSQARGFTKDLPFDRHDFEITGTSIKYPELAGDRSELAHATAATVHGSRGLTLSALHMTEAAFYPYEGVFTSLLNTLSKDPENIVVIETTANGMEGPGEPFYNYWSDAVAGRNEFLPIFLPWWEDPEYIDDPEIAMDAPADEYEKLLMVKGFPDINGKIIKLGKERIAFYRRTLATKCEGDLNKWRAEMPATPDEAFVATGNPAFDFEEMNVARKKVSKPKYTGDIIITPDKKFEFVARMGGMLLIWELPKPGHHYFMGVDTARGDENNKTSGDFAAIVGWNAETGEQAFRLAAKIGPERIGALAFSIGMFYNKAMINVELNGVGYICMKTLRDTYHYPNQYFWRGRDDKAETKGSRAYGFDTNYQRRIMMINTFRSDLRAKECFPKDKVLIDQLSAADMEAGYRVEVRVGHDDIFLAAMLGWIAKAQYHTPHRVGDKRNTSTFEKEIEIQEGDFHTQNLPEWLVDPTQTALGTTLMTANEHLKFLEMYDIKRHKWKALDGV